MSISLPSKEVYVADVPEVTGFNVTFRYNFFVPDEQVSDTGGIPVTILEKRADDFDVNSVRYLETKVPRFIVFNWNKTHLSTPGDAIIESDARSRAMRSHVHRTLIADNYDKIVSEDDFASFNYIGVTFHDGEIEDKLFTLVSGRYQQLTFAEPKEPHTSLSKAATRLNSLLPESIAPDFTLRALTNPKLAYGARHEAGGVTLGNARFDELRSSFVNAQVNAKLFYDVTSRNINSPQSPYTTELQTLSKYAKKLSASLKSRMGSTITEGEFKTTIPFIGLRVDKTAYRSPRVNAEIVGYVIDKYEVLSDGTTKQLQPIIVDNADTNTTVDIRIRYNQKYCYAIRTIALFHLPAIDIEADDVGMIQVLISSKPSAKCYVTVQDDHAPPPPADINFTWNYESDRLLIHWAFPPNTQRDIKKFQVFRRKDIQSPYELLKEYDFDDSAIHAIPTEDPEPRLIEYLTSPVTFYTDDDFTKDSRYMYTVCAIDAHGMTSCYGTQFELTFDRFKNALVKRLVSHSGAPKPYPNIYIEGEGFVNVARVQGEYTKKMRLSP